MSRTSLKISVGYLEIGRSETATIPIPTTSRAGSVRVVCWTMDLALRWRDCQPCSKAGREWARPVVAKDSAIGDDADVERT